MAAANVPQPTGAAASRRQPYCPPAAPSQDGRPVAVISPSLVKILADMVEHASRGDGGTRLSAVILAPKAASRNGGSPL